MLVVEDSPPDILLIREALETAGISRDDIQIANDGEKAFRLFERLEADYTEPCPDIVLLDINLPRKKGSDILRQIRTGKRCGAVKVIVVTSSNSARDHEEMSRLEPSGWFRKPSDYKEFMNLGPMVRSVLGMDKPPEPEPAA